MYLSTYLNHMLKGELAALGAAFCWAYNAYFFSKAGKRIGSFTVTHLRMWIALPAAAAMYLVMGGHTEATGVSLAYLLASGFIGYFLGDIFLFEAFVSIGPRLTMLIMSLAPVISAVISRFALNEVPSLLHTAAIILSTAAIAWVVGEKNGDNRSSRHLKGYLFALGGAVGQGAGMVLSKAGMGTDISPVTANFYRVSAGLAAFIIFTLIRGRFADDFKRFFSDRKSVLYVSTSTLIGPVAGVLLALYAVKTIYVGIALTLTSLSPVILIPVSHFLLKEKITPRAILGTIGALAAVSIFFFT